MLLLQVTVFALLDLCSSYSTSFVCYSKTYLLTPSRTINSVYYVPSSRDKQILVVDKGQSVNTRFEVSILNTIIMKDLTEQDDGATLIYDQQRVQLTVGDCMEPKLKSYGDVFSWSIPSSAQYLEFAQTVPLDRVLKPIVIWNRTDPSTTRGVIKYNYFEIYKLTQKDSGYYKFRGSKNDLIKWTRIKVEATNLHFEHFEGEKFGMDFPVKFSFSHILYRSQESQFEDIIEKIHIRDRMELGNSYFIIRQLRRQDTGIYKFVDKEGNVAVIVQLDVREVEVPMWALIVIACVILLCILLCCCCVKKCCCKKSKRSEAGSTDAAAPAVYYHESNQPAPLVLPLLSREPKRCAADTTIHNTAATSMDPPPCTQATVSGDMGSTSLIMSSTEYEPRFELKGLVIPSVPPLSSDTSIPDVYTSDKLNF